MEGQLSEINDGMKTRKRFHLNPSYTDNLISHDRQNFADANFDSYSLEVLLKQWAQVIL